MEKKTFLYDAHVAHGGKMVPFEGYTLPVWFSSIKDEHLAVRKSAGLFDISYMGVLRVSGRQSFSFLQRVFSNDVQKTHAHKMVYCMILNEDGMILDDVMVGLLSEDEYLLVVNASNKQKICAWLTQHMVPDVSVEDLGEEYGFIAVQGPQALDKLGCLGSEVTESSPFQVFSHTIMGAKAIVSRTGYTGETGCELILHRSVIMQVWQQLIDQGCALCGLGARDSLRIEAGLPLYGHELSETIHPLITRYPWAVCWKKEFIGKQALMLKKQHAPEVVSVGFVLDERVIPRQGYKIVEGGYVSSGTLSPYLDKPIGLGFVAPDFAAPGSAIHVEIRGKQYSARVVSLPFHK